MCLDWAGIDASLLGFQSVRGASSTKALSMGITTNDILKATDWSTKSVFQKFYFTPQEDSSYGRVVLSTSSH